MRTASAANALVSRRALYFVKKYGPESGGMAESILQMMRACGSKADDQLWTRIVAAVQSQASKGGSTASQA